MLPVKLQDVVDALQTADDFNSCFLDRRTGEIEMITDEVWSAAENDELISEYPEWQRDLILKAREIQSTDNFVELPGKFEINPTRLWNGSAMNIPIGELVRRCRRLLKARMRFAGSKI